MSDVGQAITTFVGGVIGFVTGGPAGALKGASLGYSLYPNGNESAQSPTYGFSSMLNTKSQELPVPIVYGYNQVAGNIIYEKISGENDENIVWQIALSEGPIYSANDIKANEVDIGDKCDVALGTREQPVHSLNKDNQSFPYTAYITADLEANEQISGSPTITSNVMGRLIKVYDEDTGNFKTEYSDNPAWCLYDFLTNKRYGLGIDENRIDTASFREVAAYSKEAVKVIGWGPFEFEIPRFELNYVLDTKKSSLDYIQEILATFRGFIVYSQGELRLRVDAPEEASQSFDMDNIIADSLSYWKTSKSERYNQVTVEFTDSNNDFKIKGARAADDSEIAKHGLNEKTIKMLGINSFNQAGRMANYILNKSKYCNTFVHFGAGIGSIQSEVGDVVEITHDLPGWTNKKFRIIEIAESENSELMITAQEYNEAVYSDESPIEQIEDDTTLPNPLDPPGNVRNLSATEIIEKLKDGTVLSKVQLFYDKPEQKLFWKWANVYYRKNQNEWNYAGKTEELNYIFGPVDPGEYEIKVVSESSKGVKENFEDAAVITFETEGKTDKPKTVTFDEIYWGADRIKLTWNPHPDDDFDEYEVRLDNDFGSNG